MWKFDAMENLPTIVMRPDTYAEFKRGFYPTEEEFTNGKLTGFFNAVGYFICHY